METVGRVVGPQVEREDSGSSILGKCCEGCGALMLVSRKTGEGCGWCSAEMNEGWDRGRWSR